MVLKFMVGLACVAVTAFVAEHFWRQYEAEQARQDADTECSRHYLNYLTYRGGHTPDGALSYEKERIAAERCMGISLP